MQKITLAILLLFTSAIGGYAQCIRTFQNPYMPFASNNLGFTQQIITTSYSNEFSQISGLIVGMDYLFTYTQNNSNKYITITDVSNNEIVQGYSPLTVEGITLANIRLHYSDDATCAFTEAEHTATITALLDCPTPINYTVADITTTTATFDWTPQGEETAWQVLALPNGTAAPTASTTGIDVTDDSSHTYLDLTPATKYQFYVRANCGDEFSPWNGPLNFATACEQVTSFTENFSTTAFAQLPLCWAKVINGTGSSQSSFARVSTTYGTGSSPYRSVQLYNANTSPEGNLILTLPEVSNLAAGTHRLKFFARSGGGSQSLQFGTIDQANANGVFTELVTLNSIGNTFQEYIVDYTSYGGADTYIAIRHNGTQFSSIYIDDISWEVAPTCTDVSLIEVPAVTIEATTATVAWTANGGETAWDVVYGLSSVTDPSTLTPITPAPTGTPEATLTGLTENTTYKVWVRSVCGANNGLWIGPITFKTACLPTAAINENFEAYISNKLPDCWSAVRNGEGISEYALIRVVEYNAYAGYNAFQISNGTSPANTDIMFVSPELTNVATGTHRVKFYAQSSEATGSLQVGTIDNTSTTAVFSEVETIALTSNYTEYVVEFTATDITDTFFAFRFNTAEANNSIYIDNVIWEPIPACSDVTAITVSAITTTTSTINWTPGTETEWDVVYGATTVTDPNTLTPITPAPTVNAVVSLNGLTPNTSYKVWVRSVCGDGNGAWIGPVTFATTCTASTIESTVMEGFESTVSEQLPVCWDQDVVIGTNNWKSVTAPFGDISSSASGSRILYKDYITSTAVLYSLPFDFSTITAATPIRINTYLHRHMSADAGDKYTVYANTTPSLVGAQMLLEQSSQTTAEPIVGSTGFYNSLINIPELFYGENEVYIIIVGYTGSGSSYALGIDNFKVEYTSDMANPDFDHANFKFYPNPVKDVLNLSDIQNISDVEVYNLLGQKVIENAINANSATIDMSALSSGSYIVKVTSENQIKTIKVIKE